MSPPTRWRRRRRARLPGQRRWKPWQLWLLGILAAVAIAAAMNRLVEHFFRYEPPPFYEPKDIEREEHEQRQAR